MQIGMGQGPPFGEALEMISSSPIEGPICESLDELYEVSWCIENCVDE